MNISKIGNMPFKGLLTISGQDKETKAIINTDNVVTISEDSCIGPKGDSLLEGRRDSAVITTSNGLFIKTFLPVKNVVEAYKQTKVNGESELEAKRDPDITKRLRIYL